VKQYAVRRGIYGRGPGPLGSKINPGDSDSSDIGGVDRTISRNGGASNGGGSHETAGMSAVTEYTTKSVEINTTAMVPSWRLAEESARKREALARCKALEAELRASQERCSELETALRSSRNEWQFRRKSRAS
jgi:hypothetical protein